MNGFSRRSWFVPDDVSMLDNGRLDSSLLRRVDDNCFLHHSVVEAWKRLKNAAKEDGVILSFLNDKSCYRSLSDQEYLKKINNRSVRLRVPGICSHGFGVTVLLRDSKKGSVVSDWMRMNSIKYGWFQESKFDYSRFVFVGNKKKADEIRYSYQDFNRIFRAEWLRKPKIENDFKGVSCYFGDEYDDFLIPLKSRRVKVSPGVSIKRLKNNKIGEEVCFLTDRRIDQVPYNKNPVMWVKDIVSTVEYFVKEKVDAFQGKVVAITGSSGKSSTTTLMSKILQSYGSCLSSVFSNLVDGIYPSALRLADEDFGIFEVAQGALPRVAQTLDADVAVLVSIAPAHMERHASLEDLVRCKSGIFLHRKKTGFGIINRDIPHYEIARDIAIENGRKVISYGKSEDSDFRLISYNTGSFVFSILGETFKANISGIGEHVAMNGLAVIATMHALRVNWMKSLEYMGLVSEPLNGRGNILSLSMPNGKCLLVNHAYNANPVSMRSALSTFSHISVDEGGRKIAVLTDMLELGSGSEKMHEDIADSIIEFGVDLVLIVTGKISLIRKKIPVDFPCIEFSSLNLLFAYLDTMLQGGDVVVFKGSNGTGLNKAASTFFKNKSR